RSSGLLFYTWPTPLGLPARPIGGPDRGRAPTAPALPRGKPQALMRSPSVRPPEPGASLGSWAQVVLLWPRCNSGGRTTSTTGRQLGRPPSPRWARARNRCAIARCAGGLPARAVTKGEIVDSGRGALS